MRDHHRLIARYVATRNEQDPAAREAAIAELWTEDGTYADPLGIARGRDAVAAAMAAAQARFPGLVFALDGRVDVHHDAARFAWRLGVPDGVPGGGRVIVAGTDVATFTGDGRIRGVRSFLDDIRVDIPTSPPESEITMSTILVLGGTGKTGRRIIDRLTARGLDVRAGSRSSDPPFDWADSSTWAPAMQGVDAVYISYYPDLAVPGATQAVGELTRLAVASGVRRLVLLSGRGEEEAQACERIVAAAGVQWTVVRCAWFAQNFSENFFLESVLAGEVALPSGDVPEPFVDVEDIADVAVAALTEDGHNGEIYELTGPRALTLAEAVAEIAAATGRPIRFVPVTPDDFAKALAAEGVPQELTDFLVYLFTTVLTGANASTADGVQRALGREPRDFADYVKETAATGIWNGGPA
ncbi:NAD(P)H-binding protein [Actinomadura rudentiformis]|uniref:NAD(P)H-binding protein n=1 Tax=Actinomadura rudentiformis TaxID=359158 RepID=A0A6H9YKD9_9ACTN|nr:NAD(P)H-binding protein [Actinomadura rudentiformis]KAB2339620.1 NAD(P)H-binding protein [Actinomadura rudentiformis]